MTKLKGPSMAPCGIPKMLPIKNYYGTRCTLLYKIFDSVLEKLLVFIVFEFQKMSIATVNSIKIYIDTVVPFIEI